MPVIGIRVHWESEEVAKIGVSITDRSKQTKKDKV